MQELPWVCYMLSIFESGERRKCCKRHDKLSEYYFARNAEQRRTAAQSHHSLKTSPHMEHESLPIIMYLAGVRNAEAEDE